VIDAPYVIEDYKCSPAFECVTQRVFRLFFCRQGLLSPASRPPAATSPQEQGFPGLGLAPGPAPPRGGDYVLIAPDNGPLSAVVPGEGLVRDDAHLIAVAPQITLQVL
jgi:hypothetical protein